MKFAVSTYSYHKLINSGKITQLDTPRLTKEMGFDAIEITEFVYDEAKETSKVDYAKKFVAECKKYDLPIINYTIGADFLYGSDGNLQKEIDRLKAEIDIAQILGVKGMRHDASSGYSDNDRAQRGFENLLPRIIEGCKAVTEYAQTKGIRTMIENHGFFCQESSRVEKIVNGVAHPNFGLLIDMGNFLCADEDPVQAFGRLAPFAYHVHAKDFLLKSGDSFNPGKGFFKTRAANYLRGTIVGHGVVPVAQCLSILKRISYKGYVSIEFEGMEETLESLTIGLENLKRLDALTD